MTAAADHAYEAIKSRILSGDLPPGTRLREVHLARETGVSRTPVREALRRLSAEGLAVVLPRRGAVVGQWSLADVEEIFELRVLLEGYGAGRAAQRIDETTLAELEELAREMEALRQRGRPRDLARITDLNSRFHLAIARASGSGRLVSLVSQIMEMPLVVRTFHRYSPEELARSMAHHIELVAAMRAGSSQWAENLMRTHLLAARMVLVADEGRFPTAVDPDGDRPDVADRTPSAPAAAG